MFLFFFDYSVCVVVCVQMEEADVLGDKIAIMALGRLRCDTSFCAPFLSLQSSPVSSQPLQSPSSLSLQSPPRVTHLYSLLQSSPLKAFISAPVCCELRHPSPLLALTLAFLPPLCSAMGAPMHLKRKFGAGNQVLSLSL